MDSGGLGINLAWQAGIPDKAWPEPGPSSGSAKQLCVAEDLQMLLLLISGLEPNMRH